MIDTLRLILFTACNMHCPYCCNEIESVSKQFKKMKLADIDFSKYKNICLTGGEPFLDHKLLYGLLWAWIPTDKNVYIYTNGTKMLTEDMSAIKFLNRYKDIVKGINIGVHTSDQLRVVPLVESVVTGLVRFKINEKLFPQIMKPRKYGWRLNPERQKQLEFKVELFRVKDDCPMPNEDWVLLKN